MEITLVEKVALWLLKQNQSVIPKFTNSVILRIHNQVTHRVIGLYDCDNLILVEDVGDATVPVFDPQHHTFSKEATPEEVGKKMLEMYKG
jgi:hypothetical protein